MMKLSAGREEPHLLPPELLLKTSRVDHADWNFRPLLGGIQRLRFALAVSMLPAVRVARLLEVGYGSGVFLPSLESHCEELFGVDVHAKSAEVGQMLEACGVCASLFTASAEDLPFPDGYFDRIMAVSSLEFIPNIIAASHELERVLRPDGRLVVVTPGRNAVLDFGLRLLTGESASHDYGDRRKALIPSLLGRFAVDRRRAFPPMTGSRGLYSAYCLRKLSATPCGVNCSAGCAAASPAQG
jgi:SAM-dependent methyltransferase